MSQAASARDFLYALFPELGEGILVELRGFEPGIRGQPPVLREWCRSVDQVLGICEKKRDGLDLYFGVAARSRRGGKKDALGYTCALWADLDTPDSTAALKRFEYPPSAVVASGSPGHLQAYWFLREPHPLDNPDGLRYFEERNHGLALCLGADHAWDATRIFRLPGTVNHKNGQRRPVEVL